MKCFTHQLIKASNESAGGALTGCEVTAFKNGSIIAEFSLEFTATANVSTETLNSQIVATLNNSDKFTVDPESIKVEGESA